MQKGIPDIIGRNHGIHMTPCYNKFTSILSSQLKERVTLKRLSGRQSFSLESNRYGSIRTIAISVIKLESQGTDCFTKKNYNF